MSATVGFVAVIIRSARVALPNMFEQRDASVIGRTLLGVLYAWLMAGCASDPAAEARELARQLAERGGMTYRAVPAGRFVLATFHRGLALRSAMLVVYIEGDGRAWQGGRRISIDPTPRDPIGLRLAIADPRASVLYVARPCQQIREGLGTECDATYWTSHRFAPEVIDAVEAVIDRAQAPAGSRRLGLVGYSGGATIAALIAARRPDVDWLITAAGNLDHAAWTGWHRVAALQGSMNAVDARAELGRIDQLHLAGENDRVVPPRLVEGFVRALGDGDHIRFGVIPGFDHRCCWADEWSNLLEQYAFARR